MAKDFPTAVAFFQEASASKESPEDRELVNRAFRKRRVTADMIDDESDALNNGVKEWKTKLPSPRQSSVHSAVMRETSR